MGDAVNGAAAGGGGQIVVADGDHPDTAVKRMRWVRQLIAQDACRQAPETGHERDL